MNKPAMSDPCRHRAKHPEGPTWLSNSPGNEMERPCGADRTLGDTCLAAHPAKAVAARFSLPQDLQAFLRACPIRESARLLGLSIGTIHRLLGGYWPRDPHRVLTAWGRFKERDGQQRATSWFLRRVRGGVVVHARQRFGARDLAGRDGELIAVARMPDGGLVAVALDAPAARFVLVRER